MNDYDRGDVARLEVEFKDVSAVLTDPTTVTLYLKRPDGTQVSHAFGGGTVIKDAVGQYHADISLDSAGVWHYRWLGSGGLSAGAGVGQLRVKKDVFV